MTIIDSSSNSSLLQQVRDRQDNLLERLASGRRINSAADGAAAQQIINRLTSQVEGNRQAISNSLDGISLAQVAEGGLAGINDDVNRIRELSIQAGNGILSDADRSALQAEVSQLQDNIRDTIDRTEFAGRPLLTEDSDITFQTGANSGQQIDVATQDVATGIDAILNVDISTAQGAEDAIAAADEAQEFVGGARAELGATQNRFESTVRSLQQADVDQSAARSRIQDTDFAATTAQEAAAGIQGQAAIAVQAQANQQQGQVLALLG